MKSDPPWDEILPGRSGADNDVERVRALGEGCP
jgi:hypothetical protein